MFIFQFFLFITGTCIKQSLKLFL